MAAYSVVRAKTATLVAVTADTVTITGKYRRVKVYNHHATARISLTVGAGGPPAAAVADADETYVVPAASVVTVYDDTTPNAIAVTADGVGIVLSLISAGTPTYSVVAE